MSELKNEVGNEYGPWKVTELLVRRYEKNRTARFEVICRHCGYKKSYTGNQLRFDNFAHKCNECRGD